MLLRVLRCCIEQARNQWLPPSELRQLQAKRLQAMVHHAYTQVPLYRRKFDASGIKPEDIQTVEDLVKLPFTTKQEIKQGLPNQSMAQGYALDACVRWGSSGTAGGSMPVYYDKQFLDYITAERHYRRMKMIGCNPWDRVMRIQFHMPTPTKERSTDPPRTSRRRIALGASTPLFRRWQKTAFISYSADEILPHLLDYQPKSLDSSPAYLRLVAETFVEKGVDIHLKAVSSVGELLDKPTRQFLESAFRCGVFDVYGCAEVGTIARDCQRKGLHEVSDFVIVEVIQNGEQVAPGEPGEIVVTGLLNYAMPMIRYRVGDIGILASDLCSCGRSSPLLQSVEGRIVDCFILPNGNTVSPKTIMTAVQGTPGVSRYQVVQKHRNNVIVELMRRPSDPDVSMDALITRCQQVLGDEVDIEVVVSSREHLKAKFRPVISQLTANREPRWTEPYQHSTN